MPVLIRESKPVNNIIILVYSETYFQSFFEKHCQRADTESSEYTVVVVDEDEHPGETGIRTIFEEIIVSKRFELRQGTIFVRLPLPYMAREYDGVEDKWLDDKPGVGDFRVRDCQRLERQEDYDVLLKTKGITHEDISAVQAIKERAKRDNLLVRSVWYLGHLDVVKVG